MQKVGKVLESKNGICLVEYDRGTSCDKCGQCHHANEKPTIELEGDYLPGDYVIIDLPDNQFVKASFIAYLLPLVGLILGLSLGSLISKNEAVISLFAFFGLFVFLMIIWAMEKTRKKKASWEPCILHKTADPQNIQLIKK